MKEHNCVTCGHIFIIGNGGNCEVCGVHIHSYVPELDNKCIDCGEYKYE